jgi:hypothetical protein
MRAGASAILGLFAEPVGQCVELLFQFANLTVIVGGEQPGSAVVGPV